jgi:GDP-4-dehydro-6-deoxy-D-mannose reductase
VLELDPAPDWVLHLGGLADPRAATRYPRQARSANAEGTRNLLRALADRSLPVRFLLTSTAAVYGQAALDPQGRIPAGTRPQTRTAYGWSKRLSERAALACRAPGLDVMVARPYNHAGGGQGPGYVVPDLVTELRAALAEGRPMRTGNRWPERDLLHVDDVIDAYLLLLERGAPRQVYDVARGSTCSVQEVLDGLVARLGAPVGFELDPVRARSGESPRIVGDARRLGALGWAPTRGLDVILDDAVAARG